MSATRRTRERGRRQAPASSTDISERNQATRLPFFSAPAESPCDRLSGLRIDLFCELRQFFVGFLFFLQCFLQQRCVLGLPQGFAKALTVP